MFHRLNADDLAELRAIFGAERVSTGASVLNLHSADQAYHRGFLPEAVVFPTATEEVARLMRLADERRIPVTPWGAGTSLEGNCVPAAGGVVIDFQRMDRILAVRPADFQVDVQAGVPHQDMNRELARHGLFFPPDPGANATIGGMVATNASGIRTIKYGATRDNVLRLTAVLPGGRVLHAGTRAPKSSAGYDLVRLLVGSEGTLAVVTEATLRLSGIPEEYSAAVATFGTVRQAAAAVADIMASGLEPAALELLDENAAAVIAAEGRVRLEVRPTLFVEFSGSHAAGLAADVAQTREICAARGGLGFCSGVGRAERHRLWEARHGFGEALIRAHPGQNVLIVDTAVPLSAFAEMVEFAVAAAAARRLTASVCAHAGDGNLHLNIVGRMLDPEFMALVAPVYDEIVAFAIARGGTATGEHGVGIGKRKFMRRQHGFGVELMAAIKRSFDPHGILNPGKVLPSEEPDGGAA
jgi:D-lactate dehydrogenase (cytochrome)